MVKDGDTLWDLAEHYYGKGTLHEHIKSANSGLGSTLKLGAKLTIPAPPAGHKAKKAQPLTGRTYKIQEGDTLYDLAEEFLGKSSRWEEILDANPGLEPAEMKIGMVIRLPKK